MKMACRITDAYAIDPNDYEFNSSYQDDEYKVYRTFEDITLYELMGEDFVLWAEKSKKNDFNLELANGDGEIIAKESRIDRLAMDSLAGFCKRFLISYDNIMNSEKF